ncbi:MAG: hypothetical protein BGN96_10610 [Bacteroidales bacterium 45-6]|nr:MAG: hypothetical protein BGN96_10610 [Bacteroidales bacterium 45-6]
MDINVCPHQSDKENVELYNQRFSLREQDNNRLIVPYMTLPELTALESRIRRVRILHGQTSNREDFFEIWEKSGWKEAKKFAKLMNLVKKEAKP